MVLPLTGQQYTEKVSENCVAHWKGCRNLHRCRGCHHWEVQASICVREPPGSSTFTHSPTGSLTIAFSKDGSIPEAGVAVIENEMLMQALLESIIGETKHGVSPAAKQSVALRVSDFMSKAGDVQEKAEVEQPEQSPISCLHLDMEPTNFKWIQSGSCRI